MLLGGAGEIAIAAAVAAAASPDANATATTPGRAAGAVTTIAAAALAALVPWQWSAVHDRGWLAEAHASTTFSDWQLDSLPPRAAQRRKLVWK